jgi:putative addiction module component (TIGR02574 family)
MMMNAQTQAVLDAAMSLPEADRLLIAEQLLNSVPADLDGLSEEEFAAELNRRSEEVKQGKSEGIPWSVLKEQF